jgi:hypothetical protein
MKANKFIKRIATTGIVIAVMFVVSFSDASGFFAHTHKRNQTEQFHKALEEKGYMNIEEFSVSKSAVKDSKYFVNFVNDGYAYEAYFSKSGELIEVYKIAKK